MLPSTTFAALELRPSAPGRDRPVASAPDTSSSSLPVAGVADVAASDEHRHHRRRRLHPDVRGQHAAHGRARSPNA